MKRLLIVLLVAFAATSAHSQQVETDAAPIQSIRIEKPKIEKKSGKWITGKSTLVSIETYDNDGNLVESIVFKEDGGVFVKYSAKYHDDKRKMEDTYVDDQGTIRLKTIYQYDANKRLIGMLYFGANNASVGESTVRYTAGRINEVIEYNPKGAVTERTVYGYNDDERKIELRHYLPTGFSGGTISSYDEHGRLKESISYVLDVSDGDRTLYQRDKDGHITEKSFRIGDGAFTWRYSYERDANGNWLSRMISPEPIKSGEAKPIDVTKRTITYGAGEMKRKQSTGWSLAESVASDVAESRLNGSVLKRTGSTPALRSLGLSGVAKVFVLINELGKIVFAVPHGQLGRSRLTMANTSSNQLRRLLEDTVKDWKFEPTVQDGDPMLVSGYINFNFGP